MSWFAKPASSEEKTTICYLLKRKGAAYSAYHRCEVIGGEGVERIIRKARVRIGKCIRIVAANLSPPQPLPI